jgi:hypothetical protein
MFDASILALDAVSRWRGTPLYSLQRTVVDKVHITMGRRTAAELGRYAPGALASLFLVQVAKGAAQ